MINLKSDIIDINARLKSIEAIFFAYVKVSEKQSVYNEMKKQFYEFCIDFVHKQLQELSDSPFLVDVKDRLSQKLDDYQRDYDYFYRCCLLDELDT